MSDYHPDGGQLFWPFEPIPFTVCLGLSTHGDDIRPEHMRAFRVPAGKGIYLNPSTSERRAARTPATDAAVRVNYM